MMDFGPLPWGEGGESSEPNEGFLPTEPRSFGIRVHSNRWHGSPTLIILFIYSGRDRRTVSEADQK
jgi:hypothetical protein